MHKKSGKFVIVFSVYAGQEIKSIESFELTAYVYVGEAIENSHGVTCIFPDSWNSQNEFEYIGEFE